MQKLTEKATARAALFATIVGAILACTMAFAGPASAGYSVSGMTFRPTTGPTSDTLNVRAGERASTRIAITANTNNPAVADDDLSSFSLDLPVGQMINAGAVSGRCAITSFNQGTCPSNSLIGAARIDFSTPTNPSDYATGLMYVLAQPTYSNSVMSIGVVLTPHSFSQKVFLTLEVGYQGMVRPAADSAYGTRLSMFALPVLMRDAGSSTYTDISISRLGLDFMTAAGVNVTRCDTANWRGTVNTYRGVSTPVSGLFQPTGCSLVPFAPSLSTTTSSTMSGAPVTVSTNMSIPNDAVASSHLKYTEVNLGPGSGINSTVANGVVLCTDAQLSSDACPAGSKVGKVSLAFPFAPGAAGDIYLIARTSNRLDFAYVYRINGNSATKVVLKGSASATGGNVYFETSGFPEALTTSVNFNYTTLLFTNPRSCLAPPAITTAAGLNGTVKTLNEWSWSIQGCPSPPTVTCTRPTSTSYNCTWTLDSHWVRAECSFDYAVWDVCTSGVAPASGYASAGYHTFAYRFRDAYGFTGPEYSKTLPAS